MSHTKYPDEYVKYTDDQFKKYAKECCQSDWKAFKAKLLADEAAFDVAFDKFFDEQIAKNDSSTAMVDLAEFLLCFDHQSHM